MKGKRPAVCKILEDLHELGYICEHQLVDSYQYLLPHRRNRFYLTAIKMCSDPSSEQGKATELLYAKHVERIMNKLA
eukprot:6457699-Karenia_brevis.AAC.1